MGRKPSGLLANGAERRFKFVAQLMDGFVTPTGARKLLSTTAPKVQPQHLTLAEVQDVVAKFKVGFPLSLLKPKFWVVEAEADRVMFYMTIGVPHRDTGEETYISNWDKCPLPAIRDPEIIYRTLRKLLQIVLLHEMDESIQVNGKRIYDPHDPQLRIS